MVSTLPHPVYENAVTKSNSSGNWNEPARVTLWSDFLTSAVHWIDANHEQHSQRVARPVFVDGITISEEVQTLQPFIKLNLLDVAAKCFIPSSRFTAIRGIKTCAGFPDQLLTRNGEIIAVVEVKGKWTLTSSDIVNSMNGSIANAVSQLYHYMRLNHRKFGILTSYEYTWFAYRSQEYSNDGVPVETLFITNGIAYTDQNPTVLQSFAYFNSLANNEHMDSPSVSKRSSRTNSSTNISRVPSPTSSPRVSIFKDGRPLSAQPPHVNHEPQEFDANDFQLNSVLGEARSKVYLEQYENDLVALKVSDVSRHSAMLPELLNEVSIYNNLVDLQGKGIPKLLCHGYIEKVLYCIGLSPCGSVPTTFTDRQKQALLETLENIHQRGILHNDIKKENILIDELGNPFIIDFGFATRDASEDAHLEEKNHLLYLIESNM